MKDETEPIRHLTLMHRVSEVSEEWGVSLETSLYRSEVTGHYMLEQVRLGRHETTTDSISLGPTMIAELLPLLTRIAEEAS